MRDTAPMQASEPKVNTAPRVPSEAFHPLWKGSPRQTSDRSERRITLRRSRSGSRSRAEAGQGRHRQVPCFDPYPICAGLGKRQMASAATGKRKGPAMGRRANERRGLREGQRSPRAACVHDLKAVVPCAFHPPTFCRECRELHNQIKRCCGQRANSALEAGRLIRLWSQRVPWVHYHSPCCAAR